jgi:activator of HSP90 ATPase
VKTKDVRQSVLVKAPAPVVYRALVRSRDHARLVGAPAKIGAKVGSPFSVWDGAVSGITLHLVENRRIVQAWRGVGWPAGHYSIADFTLRPAGRGATRLTFGQYGVPAARYPGIARGWKTYYWDRMKEILAGGGR